MSIEDIAALESDEDSKYPSLNQVFTKEALSCLTKRQLQIWEYMAYEKYTQDLIATKLGIAQPVVSRHIKAATKKLTKWFKEHETMYDLLKENK